MATGPVLIVEDNPDTRRALGNVLELQGTPAVGVPDGKAALEYLRTAPVGVIVLDLCMPDMDGRAFLEAKAADPAIAEVPVVVYSAVDGHELPLGVPFVSKGAHPEQLLEVVARLLRGPAAA